MAKKRSRPKASTTHHEDGGHAPGMNGFDHGGARHDGPDAGHATDLAPRAAAGGLLAADGFLSRIIYTASYGVSFGIVFPVMFLAHTVPTENALVRGLIDGGRAAGEAVAALYDESPAPGVIEPAHSAEPAAV
jgi:hypothetical protein